MIKEAARAIATGLFGGNKLVPRRSAAPKGMQWEYHPGAFSRMLDIGWRLDSLNQFQSSYLPSVAVVCEVDVFGSPLSNKDDLYFLALSIAFGVINYQLVRTVDNVIETFIDHTGKHIRVKMTQSYSGFIANLGSLASSISGNAIIRKDPQENINAGTWPPFLKSADAQIQQIADRKLPSPSSVLISEKKAPNYQPQSENGSVENDLINLIAASILFSGCSNPTENTLAEIIDRKLKVSPITYAAKDPQPKKV